MPPSSRPTSAGASMPSSAPASSPPSRAGLSPAAPSPVPQCVDGEGGRLTDEAVDGGLLAVGAPSAREDGDRVGGAVGKGHHPGLVAPHHERSRLGANDDVAREAAAQPVGPYLEPHDASRLGTRVRRRRLVAPDRPQQRG